MGTSNNTMTEETQDDGLQISEATDHPDAPPHKVSYGTPNGEAAPESRGSSVKGDEEQALLSSASSDTEGELAVSTIATIVSILLLGEFIASADATLIFAAGPTIASALNRLEDVNWLSTSYVMGICAVQPMLGKLSDIWGRKPILLLSYVVFALGNLLCGISNTLLSAIVGRVISGVGGAGIMTISSIIITDLVPKRDVALWRSYVNLAMTLGRSLGGPVGGWLTDALGWRAIFIGQVPLVLIAALLVVFKLQVSKLRTPPHDEEASMLTKLRRVDFLGTVLLAVAVIASTLLLDMGGQKFAWKSWYTVMLLIVAIPCFAFFVLTEAYLVPEPIFSLHLLRSKDVVLSYLTATLQIAAQVSMMFSIPLYFKITKRASNTAAGAHLVPAVLGNAIGSLLTGALIKRTGRYKLLTVSAGLLASITYILQLLRWNGNTGPLESLYIIPGGFGTGIAGSATFISMTAALDSKDIAMGTSGLFLIMNLGIVAGVTASNSALETRFRNQLEQRIHGPDASEVIQRALSDASYIASLTGKLRRIVVSSYVGGLHYTWIISLACSLLAFVSAGFLSNRQL